MFLESVHTSLKYFHMLRINKFITFCAAVNSSMYKYIYKAITKESHSANYRMILFGLINTRRSRN